MRLHSPTGYILAFFPAAFGVMLAYQDAQNLLYLPLFLVGSILARGAGCIINDIWDQDIDKRVVRTKDRPLASGVINTKQALILLALVLLCCLVILLSLTATAIVLGFISVLLITLYPLMKRVTYFPQVFLGLTFNMGCLIGYAAITNNISRDAVLLYCACGFWSVAYDTIYAFMDIEDDKKIGVKSTAILLEHNYYKTIIAMCYVVFFSLFIVAFRQSLSMILWSAISISFFISIIAVISLDVRVEQNCLRRFKMNNYIGFILFASILLEKL
ncbi:MAG: 4-hydroxybenzoate octaprenyltransferase [Rickettsiaceae bacterium]